MTHRRRRFLGLMFGLILLGVTVLAIALLEHLASLRADTPGSNVRPHLRLDHTWAPHTTHVHREWTRNPEFRKPYTHSYEAHGWVESYDVAKRKAPGTYRIFYVGDSFTEGTAPMEESVPSRVESELGDRFRSSGLRFEVINTGTTSYSPTIYSILIRHYLAEFDPDLIVINVDMTDDFDDWKYRPRLVTDSEGNPWALPPRNRRDDLYIDTADGLLRATPATRLHVWLYEHSALFNFIQQRWGRTAEARQATPPPGTSADGVGEYQRWSWTRDRWDDRTRANVAHSMGLLEGIARFCRARGIRVLLTGVPHYQQFAAEPGGQPEWSRKPHDAIEAVARAADVAYFDSLEPLRPIIEGTPQSAFYYRGDMHLNPRGYEVWSRAHLEALTDPARRLLPDSAYR